MPKIAIINMLIGFCVIFLAAAAGAFIANDTTLALQKNKELLNSWQMILSTSAHGHTNLFGILHILFGLTIPYSTLSIKLKKLQTFGFLCGTFAMSTLMLTKSYFPPLSPESSITFLDVSIGSMLSLTLVAIGLHCYGLLSKTLKRN